MLLRIATRASPLARAQAALATATLLRIQPQLTVKLVPIVSDGDKIKGSLINHGGKESFVHSLQQALKNDEADVACHSLKDLGPDKAEFCHGAYLPRAVANDVLIGSSLAQLARLNQPVIATSSPRREGLLRNLLPKAQIKPLRGNIGTRISKADDFDAIVLACAGLLRLRLESKISHRLATNSFIPAAGQGIIVLETLVDKPLLHSLLSKVNDQSTAMAATAERACVAAIGGNCFTPLGAYATLSNNRVKLASVLVSPDGTTKVAASASSVDPIKVGQLVASKLLSNGGEQILADIPTHE